MLCDIGLTVYVFLKRFDVIRGSKKVGKFVILILGRTLQK